MADRFMRHGEESFDRLFHRFFYPAAELAKQQLPSPLRVADEEDIALSAFRNIYEGLMDGRLDRLCSDLEFWRLLKVIVRQKAIDQIRHVMRTKRGGGKVRGESVFNTDNETNLQGIDQIPDQRLAASVSVMVNEKRKRLLNELGNDLLRRIAIWKMDGYTNREIADRLGVCERTIERKLSVIRKIWWVELQE